MDRKTLKIAAVLAAILIISTASLAFLNLKPTGSFVVIVRDGKIIERLDLSKSLDRSFTITAANGSENTISIKNGKISISSATCPDQTCVHMGELQNEASPIVCLPNKLIIRFDGTEEAK